MSRSILLPENDRKIESGFRNIGVVVEEGGEMANGKREMMRRE